MKFVLFLLALSAYAGDSLQYGANFAFSNAIPNTSTNMVEFYLHDWASTNGAIVSGSLGSSGACGWGVSMVSGATVLQIANFWETSGAKLFNISLALSPKAIYVRLQHDSSAKLDVVEAWDTNGNRIFSDQNTYTAETISGTDFWLGTGVGDIAFMRMFNALVGINAKPPTTVAANLGARVFEWKFDGSLADASGNSHPASYSSGSPSYVPTPYQNTVAVVATLTRPTWVSIVPLRSGHKQQLDGGLSFSQNDASNAVTYEWQQLSGPSNALVDSRTSGTPTLSGLIFGDYLWQLTVTDVSGQMGQATGHVGAVATDTNNIVVQANPAAQTFFGDMILWGKNPWGFADYWQEHSRQLRRAYYTSSGWDAFQWEQHGAGTVQYYWNGVGPFSYQHQPGTTITTGISATDTSIVIADATKLDFSDLPTRVIVGLYTGSAPFPEEIRVCSIAGSVPATLTVCYDGRGQDPHSWLAGAPVSQFRIAGTSTHFLTDSTAPVCPVGAGPPGPASYSTGTMTLTAGSTAVVGSGTTWTVGMIGSFVRASATHSSTPYKFVAQIAAVADATHLTLARAYPASSDTGSFSYAILPASRTIVLTSPHATDPSGTGTSMWQTSGCETETSLYSYWQQAQNSGQGNSFASAHDVPALDGTLNGPYPYGVTDTTGWVSGSGLFNLDYYGEDLSWRSLYLRSGLTSALETARTAAEIIKSPWGNVEVMGGSILLRGGLGIGGFASLELDPSTTVTWSDMRSYANQGAGVAGTISSGGAAGCNAFDSRDTGYGFTWLALGGIFDPDNTFKTTWQAAWANMNTADNNCKQADNSWANGAYWNTNFGPLTMTNGSTAVTGVAISNNYLANAGCSGVTTGTGSVTSGGGTLTITGGSLPQCDMSTCASTPPGASPSSLTGVAITGTQSGQPFTQSYLYSYTSGPTAVLSVLWPGDTGTVTWMAFADQPSTDLGAMTTFATSGTDPNLAHNYTCLFNSSTSITLNRPWEGSSGGGFYGRTDKIAGHGQQPFMLGIRSHGQNLIANSGVAPYAANYQTFQNLSTQWIHDNGVDSGTLTTNYGRVFQYCEPTSTANTNTFDQRQVGCNYGATQDGMTVGREQNQELGSALSLFYQLHPTSPNKTYLDQLYGAVWGNAGYNTGGVFVDSASCATNIGASNLLDADILRGKWPGFFCGVGNCPQWPAVRLGGVATAVPRILPVAWTCSGIPSCAKVQIILTEPDGNAHTPVVCSSSPCAVPGSDARQGDSLMQVNYLNSSNVLLAAGDPFPVYVQ